MGCCVICPHHEALSEERDAEIESLLAQVAAGEALEWFIRAEGYVPCDIPACNCNSWHGGHAHTRLREISDALGDRTQGKTILTVVNELVAADEREKETHERT